jgi:hypothetical protein
VPRRTRVPRSAFAAGACAAGAFVAAAFGAYLGAWWVPFPVGVAVGALGAAGRPRRGGVLAAVAGAVLGWALPLWVMALSSLPAGATARTIAALAGLPPYAAVAVAVTLLLAALQVLAGAWLARAVFPRRTVARQEAGALDQGDSPDMNIGQA